MQQFLAQENLKQAVALSAMVTLLSWPRLAEADRPPALLIILFVLVFLMAGAATAWGAHGGMAGAFPERRRILAGVVVAFGAAVVLAPIQILWIDGPVKSAMTDAGAGMRVTMSFPATISGVLALVAWSASFETLFLRASTMAVLARVFRRGWVAIAGAVALRLWVTHLNVQNIQPAGPAYFYAVALADGLAGSLLFARFGLPAASLFAALMSARHLVALW